MPNRFITSKVIITACKYWPFKWSRRQARALTYRWTAKARRPGKFDYRLPFELERSIDRKAFSISHQTISHPPHRADRYMKRSNTSSLRHSKRSAREKKALSGSSCTIGSLASRKVSALTCTSGTSILYPGRMTTKDRRLLKMILVIFVSFVICYLPITAIKIIRAFHDIHLLHIMGYMLIYLTTCINPIIYVVMSSEYRQAYRNLLLCRNLKRSKTYAKSRKSPQNQKEQRIKAASNKV